MYDLKGVHYLKVDVEEVLGNPVFYHVRLMFLPVDDLDQLLDPIPLLSAKAHLDEYPHSGHDLLVGPNTLQDLVHQLVEAFIYLIGDAGTFHREEHCNILGVIEDRIRMVKQGVKICPGYRHEQEFGKVCADIGFDHVRLMLDLGYLPCISLRLLEIAFKVSVKAEPEVLDTLLYLFGMFLQPIKWASVKCVNDRDADVVEY